MITGELTGRDQLDILLTTVHAAMDPEEVLDEMGAVLLNRIRSRFLNQEAPDGSSWPTSRGAIRRQQSGQGGGTLFDTGSLFRSIQLFTVNSTERMIAVDPTARNTRTGAQVASYALKHQRGLEGNETRVFLGFSDDDVATVNLLLMDRLRKKLDGN